MKYFGFWKEEGYLGMPSILDSVNKSESFDEHFEKKLLRYLNLFPPIFPTYAHHNLDAKYSIVDGSLMSSNQDLIFDGKWIWTEDVWHYYKENKVKFPTEFIEDVKKASRYPYFMLFLKTMWFRIYRIRKLELKILEANSYPKISLDGKHFDLAPATTNYKTSLLFSIPKSSVKVKIALFELIIISNKKFRLDFSLVVSEVIETEKEIKLRLNTLSLEASFFEKYLHQDFWLSRIYLDQKMDLEDTSDRGIPKARLEKIEVFV
jgi:hypothetical protein